MQLFKLPDWLKRQPTAYAIAVQQPTAPRWTDVMIDLETFATCPTALFPSIGAVAFNRHTGEIDVDNGFYTAIDLQSCIAAGLTIDGKTIEWWFGQTDAARKALFDAPAVTWLDRGGRIRTVRRLPTLAEALRRFSDWMGPYNQRFIEQNPDLHPGIRSVNVWGNGADFDKPIIENAYYVLGMPRPWDDYRGRCYRTLKNDWNRVAKPPREGTHHKALDDALFQARHLIAITAEQTLAKQALADRRVAQTSISVPGDE